MYIGVLGPIATNDLLLLAEQDSRPYPAGRAGAPLVSDLIREYLARVHRGLALTLDDQLADDAPPFVPEGLNLTYVVVHAHYTYGFALAGLAYDRQTLVTVHDNALIILRYVRTLHRLFHLLMPATCSARDGASLPCRPTWPLRCNPGQRRRAKYCPTQWPSRRTSARQNLR